MGITFKYDAAGVTPPSNQSTRKFGQQLVMAEQQRKYQAQQQGYDRLFQLGRDVQQNAFQVDRDNRIADFQAQQAVDQGLRQAGRDKALFDQRQKEMAAEQQFKFMEEARKQSSGMIMEDIKNGMYDPATARKLQQSIADEAEALGNPTLDATQRAEALKKIRAKRLIDSANRLEKPPPPTPEQALQSFLGDEQYARYGHLPWVPDGEGKFSISKEALGQQQKEQEQLEAGRPKSFQDYYSANEDKFQKDLDATMQSMQVPNDKGEVPTVTREQALEQMQKDYDFRQKALGRPQYGDPTNAPAEPVSASQGLNELRKAVDSNGGIETPEISEAAKKIVLPHPTLGPLWKAIESAPEGSYERALAEDAYATALADEMKKGRPATPGAERSILETGQPAGIAPGSALARQRDALGMNAPAPAATQPAMGGQPPAPEQTTSFGQMLAEGRDALKADPSNKEAKANLESLVKSNPTLAPLYEAYAKAPKGSEEQRSAQKAYSDAFYKEMQSPGQSQNSWSEVASGGSMQAAPAEMPKAPSPDFASLSKGANESDREELQSMQAVYSGLPQGGQQAMNVILSDSATKEQKAAANKALLQMGINLQEELSKRSRVKAGDFYTPMMS